VPLNEIKDAAHRFLRLERRSVPLNTNASGKTHTAQKKRKRLNIPLNGSASG